MKIGIIQLDGKIPNLALMKVAGYHETIGDTVEWLYPDCNYHLGFSMKGCTFAWDKFNDGKLIMQGIERCNKAGIPNGQMQFFVLIGFDTTPAQDLERVMTLANLGCMPFVMPYNKSDKYQKAFFKMGEHESKFSKQ